MRIKANKPAVVREVRRPEKPANPTELRTEESELVGRLRCGDDHAFEELVRKYAPKMLVVARRFLREEQDARDAVQDALISAVRAIKGFNEHAQLSTWLHRIVVNASLMELRRRRRRLEDSIEDQLPRFDQNGKWVDDSLLTPGLSQLSIERRETRELVRRCIALLPDAYRTVLLMRDIEDLDIDEIARMLNATSNAIKVRLHRARQALRPIIEREIGRGGSIEKAVQA